MNMTLEQPVISPVKIPSVSISVPVVRYIGPKFRVKLSYPSEKEITLATADGKTGQLFVDKRKIVMKVSQKVQV